MSVSRFRANVTSDCFANQRVRFRKNKIVSRGDTVVPALLVHGRLHPRQDKTRETKPNLSMNSMNTADAALETLRDDVIDIVLGTIFLVIGATACAIAAIRWRRGVRILLWFGIFSGMYGLQKLGLRMETAEKHTAGWNALGCHYY